MQQRSAYLAPPRLSFVTTLLNIPNLLNFSDGDSPIILMDQYDYDRIRARTLTGVAENQKGLYLTMAFDELCRRGVIQLVDYADLYSPSKQEQHLRQNQTLLTNTPERIHEQLAVKAINDWSSYARGTYQEPFRAALSEDTDTFADLRRDEDKQRRKMERGTGDPFRRNEKTLNKGAAALSIRERADQMLNLNVQGVICSRQYEILDDFLAVAQSSQPIGSSTEELGIESDIADADISSLENLEPMEWTVGFSSDTVSETRGILDTISTIATELSEVQYDDWFLLGPSFAIPQYSEIFDWDIICMDVEDGLNVNDLISETKYAIEGLKNGKVEGLSPDEFEYESRYVSEEYDLSPSYENSGLRDMFKYAFGLSNYSRELWCLIEQHNISQMAALTAVSIVKGEQQQFSDVDISQRCIELMSYFDPLSIEDMKHEQIRKERQSNIREGNTDWFETADRWR